MQGPLVAGRLPSPVKEQQIDEGQQASEHELLGLRSCWTAEETPL